MVIENWTFRQNVHNNKGLLKDLRILLTNEIQGRKPREPQYLDFRFLLPLAQWLCEQGGYTITPKGNNPGNVMGKGDLGVFERKDNKEVGENVVRNKDGFTPANFAQFSSMEAGTKATFNHLQERWFGTYTQILDGGSAENYVKGLYPGHGKDYATQYQSVYTSGVRVRLGNIIEDYIAVLQDDLRDLEKEKEIVQKNYQQATQENAQNLFGDKKMSGVISHNMNERRLLDVAPKIEEGFQKQKTQKEQEFQEQKNILEEQIAELKKIQTRFKSGQSLQPVVAQAAMP
ncbi:hypothetical protein BH10ACI1_BH10ACI1_16940 [soil metagenome]